MKRTFTSSNHQFQGMCRICWFSGEWPSPAACLSPLKNPKLSSYDRTSNCISLDPLKGPVNSYVLEAFFSLHVFPFYLQHPFFSPRFRRDPKPWKFFWMTSVGQKTDKKNHGQKSLKFQSRMVSFLLFSHGIFWIFGDGETHPFFWYGIFPCSALESLALLGFVTRGPLCIGYRRSLNNAKDLGLQFCKLLVVWLSGGLLVGWWVNWIISPGVTKEKNVWNHHLVLLFVVVVGVGWLVGWLVGSCRGIRHGYPQAPPLFRRPWKLPLHPSLRDETNTDLHGTKRPEDVPSAPWPAAKGSRELHWVAKGFFYFWMSKLQFLCHNQGWWKPWKTNIGNGKANHWKMLEFFHLSY